MQNNDFIYCEVCSCKVVFHKANVIDAFNICDNCGFTKRVGKDKLKTSEQTSRNKITQQHVHYFFQDEDHNKVTQVEISIDFWRRARPITDLLNLIKTLTEGTIINLKIHLLEGRLNADKFRKNQLEDWPYTVGFTWQTVFTFLHSLGLRNISLENKKNKICLIKAKITIPPKKLTLSVIMPVYNEEATLVYTFNNVYKKLEAFKEINFEIILVESNSTDNSRALVRNFEGKKSVKVILQDTPRGKGFAVREGLAKSNGEIILIQDADDEYNVNDYDHLLRFILSMKGPFLLGSRDTTDWKMRAFKGASLSSFLYNVGHIFFTGYLNILLGTKIKDPFTMYKVFLKDCVFDVEFICNRFDFDHELVIKLVRKGFVPPELLVSYTSRSHKEGKKVSIIKDALFWITTDLRLRFSRLKKKI